MFTGFRRRSSAITNVISQLFRLKYTSAKTISAGRIAYDGEGCLMRGGMPAMMKNSWAPHHADTAGADILKRARCGPFSFRRLEIQNEIISPSRATMIVPAAGPYRRTAVKTNVSEREIEAEEEGSVTVAEPLTSVNAARMKHWFPMGSAYSPAIESPITAKPAPITDHRYALPNLLKPTWDTIGPLSYRLV